MIHISAFWMLVAAAPVALAATSEPPIIQAALCDSAGVVCDGEDDVTYSDMSLLQLDVSLNHEAQVQPMPHAAKDHHHALHKSTIAVLEAAAKTATSAAGTDNAAVTHGDASAKSRLAHKAAASTTARVLAWLQRHGVELVGQQATGDGVAVGIVLLGALAVCLVVVLGGMGGAVKDKDPDRQESPLRPPGAAPVSRTPLASRSPGPDSRLPTQQSLNQRSPLVSSTALPTRTQMKSGPEEVAPPMIEKIAQESTDVLPPICPSLILPHTEARFMIQTEHLLRLTTGSVNILGTSGRKLLHALVCDSPDGRRCLMLASCGCEDDPRTCIFTPQGGVGSSQALEVFGKGGKFYGWLEFPGGSRAMLAWAGNGTEHKPVMQIDLCVGGEDLSMKASTPEGRVLASAGRDVAGGTGMAPRGAEDTWKMQVKPGVDAVLITSCMLAIILLKPLGGPQERPSGSTVGGTAASLRPIPAGSPSAPLSWPGSGMS